MRQVEPPALCKDAAEAPTNLKLVTNLNTANTLGLTIAQSVQICADRVIVGHRSSEPGRLQRVVMHRSQL